MSFDHGHQLQWLQRRCKALGHALEPLGCLARKWRKAPGDGVNGNPTTVDSNLKVENVVQDNSKVKAMVGAQTARTSEQMVGKENSAFVAESLDDILPFAYEKACIGVRYITYIVFESVLLDLLRKDGTADTLYRHISTNFHSKEPTDKVGRKLLSTNSCMAAIAPFIHRRPGKAITV